MKIEPPQTNGLPARTTILLVAKELVEQGRKQFSIETLSVLCWKKDCKTFGLKGYELRHLNHNVVCCALYGKKGLLSNGFFIKSDDDRLELTQKGFTFRLFKEYKEITATELGL